MRIWLSLARIIKAHKCRQFVVAAFFVGYCCSTHAAIQGEYYNQNGQQRAYFTGTKIDRVDANIGFNWGGGAPVSGVGRDDFSVRWTGEFEVPTSGNYVFTTRSDDGVRLIVNGTNIIENWTDHGPTFDFGTVVGLLVGERYTIQMEFYERGGRARAELYWDGPGFSREIIPAGNLFLDLRPPEPVSASSPCLGGTISLLFNEAVSQASAENLANYSTSNGVVLTSATLTSNPNVVTLTYFAGNGLPFTLTVGNISDTSGNAIVSPVDLTVASSANGLLGSYFDQNGAQRQYFTGNSVDRGDPVVDFDWSTGTPLPGLNNDYFSVRWSGEVEATTNGAYRFYTVSDDGVRLYLDGNLIINNWGDHSATTNTSAVQVLNTGQRYSITMEFYEHAGFAQARLQWRGPGFARETIPTQNLFYGCSSVIAIPVAEWLLDESRWTGAPAEVLDNSGNGLVGSAINLDALPSTSSSNSANPSNPGTCGYGRFDGINDGYLQIDDPGSNSLLDLDTEYSVTSWIYPTDLPNGVDIMTILSKDENYEFHLNSAGQIFWWWGGGDRQFTSVGTVNLNQWNHVAVTYRSGEQVIYLNGSSVATHTSTTALTVNNDPLLIGSDIAFHSRRFEGFIDEVKLYSSALNALSVNTVMAETHPCVIPTIDHFALAHLGSAVTCEAETVTIGAHDLSELSADAAGITIEVSATSASPGWLAADASWQLDTGAGTFSIPADGAARYTFASAETSVVLVLANTSEALIDIDVVDVNNSSVTDIDGGGVEDPPLPFKDTALRFYNDANGDENADGTDPIAGPFVAGDLSVPFVLKAIETSSETGACVARLLGSQNVNFAYECRNPNSCVRDQDMQIAGSAIEDNNNALVVDFSSLAVNFDGEGEVALNLRYFDAGLVRLHANVSLAANDPDAAITLNGTSAEFVVRPADLRIVSIQTVGGAPNPGSTGSGLGFVSAGSAFSVAVEAVGSSGSLTPNFGRELSPELIRLNLVSLVMPVGGVSAPLNAATSFVPGFALGQFDNTAVSWPEAGTITINTTIADGDYLGTGDLIGTTSGNVGRFFPAYLQLDYSALTPGCVSGGFSYMADQLISYRPIIFSYGLSAQGSGTGLLQNFDSVLGYPVSALLSQAEHNNNGINLGSRSFIPVENWQNGEMVVNADGGFARAMSGVNEIPDGPLDSVKFGLQASGGADNVNFPSTSLNMNASASGDCGLATNCNAMQIGDTQELRFGRMSGRNSHGPETANLSLPLIVEYWDGVVFTQNTNDSCTVISLADIQFDSASINIDANRTVALGAGSSTGTFAIYTPGIEFGFIGGDAQLDFSAPGLGNSGRFDVDLNTYPWLRYDWNQNGNFADDVTLPSLEVEFGRYRGHDRVIYWHEVFR
ncbi:MAG: MSHA biogenesis protein MshQ [Lentisphaeria bacterium]|jgi:MSHA biogenesis protein MshQ